MYVFLCLLLPWPRAIISQQANKKAIALLRISGPREGFNSEINSESVDGGSRVTPDLLTMLL